MISQIGEELHIELPWPEIILAASRATSKTQHKITMIVNNEKTI